jgi:DNA-directed RNA polymerase specialized sigma24 family protein
VPGRGEILRIMYEDADIAEAIGKMDPPNLRDDLRQEIFLVLAEMDEALLIQRYNEGWLRYYIVRTMLNMIKSDRSTFYNRFRRGFEQLGDIGERLQDEGQDEAEKSIEGHLSGLHWYERKLIEIYSENGRNVAKISRETGIPYRSLFKTIKKTKALLKTEIKAGQAPERKIRARITIEIGIPKAGTTDDICDELEAIQGAIEAAINTRPAFRRMSDLRITQTK